MTYLTIAIPTYNRSRQVCSLLVKLISLIQELGLAHELEILISNNCSEDNTKKNLEAIKDSTCDIKLIHQNANLGYDRNILELYQQATGRYIWFLGDDDQPKLEGLKQLVTSIKELMPSLIIAPFEQPPKNPIRNVMNHGETFPLVYKETEMAITAILNSSKLSSYVLSKDKKDYSKIIEQSNCFIGLGWMHQILALSTLLVKKNPIALSINETLACSAEGFEIIEWDPAVVNTFSLLKNHLIFEKVNKKIIKNITIDSYYNSIQFAYAFKRGKLKHRDEEILKKFYNQIRFKRHLILNLKKFLQYVIIKVT